MTTDPKTLGMLLEREEAARDAALAAAQQAQRQAEAACAQAEQLLAYRSDYQQRWTAQFRTAGSVEILRCYQSFSERLGHAIEQQQRTAESALARLRETQAALAAQELRVASVRKLIERRVADLGRLAERRDQKQTDEAAQRAAWRLRADSRLAPL